MKILKEWFNAVADWLAIPLFTLGKSEITLWTLLSFLILIILLFFFAKIIRHWVVDKLLARTKIIHSSRHAAGTVIQYSIIVIGTLVILQTVGIDLTTLNILAGAVGIGVGFGLQTIASNLLSGLIILFERPIKLGDRIDVNNVEGDVIKIGVRSTTVLTNDNISIIIPNSTLISENVINWSHNNDQVRFKIPVSVSYESDVREVEKLLLQVASENLDVLKQPEPAVRFLEFGDNGLLFELRAWSITLTHQKGKLISDLNFAIIEKFRQYNIQIPFPQRDIHILTQKRR